MKSCEHAVDIIINSLNDIDKINKLNDTVNNIQLLYINTKLTRVQLKHVCNILNPQHIIFRQNSNNTIKAPSESVVFSIPFVDSIDNTIFSSRHIDVSIDNTIFSSRHIDVSIDNTIFSSSVNRITFYWNRNRPLTKNIYPSWIYEMYNNIFHNIESLNELCITKSQHKSTKRMNSNRTKGIHK
jgi:hypothetical protein